MGEHAWSFAGRSPSLVKGDPWWAVCSLEHLRWRLAYPGVQAVYERVRRDAWDEVGDWGDRRQELVFIGGLGMNEAAIRAELDGCLLTQDEMDVFQEVNRGRTAALDLSLGPGLSLYT